MVAWTARGVFKFLDTSAIRVKEMLAAEVTRLEAESRDKTVRHVVYGVLRECPEIRQLCLQ